MTRSIALLIAIGTVIASGLHLISDIMEWFGGGFSQPQLLINYAGFLLMPFVVIALYAIQRPAIGWSGLVGALLYGFSFIYFAHTTLLSIELYIPNYEALWTRLGSVYTFHGVMMIVGGLLFGIASLRAKVLSRIGILVFISGILLNLIVGLLPMPDIVQIIGSTFRNLGLIAIGIDLISNRKTENI